MSETSGLSRARIRGLSRLDKFLAAEGRRSVRADVRPMRSIAGRSSSTTRKPAPRDAARRLHAGRAVRLWMDRPGQFREASQRLPRRGELPIVYEDESLYRRQQAGGAADRAAAAPRGGAFSRGRARPTTCARRAGAGPSWCTASTVNVGPRGLRHSRGCPDDVSRTSFAATRPSGSISLSSYGVPSPPRGTWRDHLVWDQESLIQRETHARDPRGERRQLRLRGLETFGIDASLIRGQPRDRQAQPDTAAGAAARPHAGRRAAVRLWPRRSSIH